MLNVLQGGILSARASKGGSKPKSMAERLSYNRAVKRAAADSAPARHIADLHHLARRIEVRHVVEVICIRPCTCVL